MMPQLHDSYRTAAVSGPGQLAPAGYSPFGGGSPYPGTLPPPTPPRGQQPTAQAAQVLANPSPFNPNQAPSPGPVTDTSSTTMGFDPVLGFSTAGYSGSSFTNAAAYSMGNGMANGMGSGSDAYRQLGGMAGDNRAAGASPVGDASALMPPGLTAADLAGGYDFAAMQQQQWHMQQDQGAWGGFGGGGSNALAAAAAAMAFPSATPLPRASTLTAQQMLQHQQQQQQLARSLTVDAGMMAAAAATGAGGQLPMHMWGERMPYTGGSFAMDQQGRPFGAVYDMKSLTGSLAQVQAGTGDVRRLLATCTFRPRLPGLTKLVSQLSREGHWAKALEVYESLDAVGVRPDTTITNAAISACDKGGQWEKAMQVFRSMSDLGMERDAITYSALISALSKGRQWATAIDLFNHMVAEGVECDAVTCCSLITALDKGGQWQLAEQVFIQMYQCHPHFHVLLEGMQQDSPSQDSNGVSTSTLLAGTFSAAALSALSIQDTPASVTEQLAGGAAGLTAATADGSGGDTGANTKQHTGQDHHASLFETVANGKLQLQGWASATASASGSIGSEVQDNTNIVRTLSAAWSKVVGGSRWLQTNGAQASTLAGAARAGGAGVTSTGSNSSSSSGEGGNGATWHNKHDNLLATSDAVVLLPGTDAASLTGKQQQAVTAKRSLSAQLSDIGLPANGRSMASHIDQDAAAAADNSDPAAARGAVNKGNATSACTAVAEAPAGEVTSAGAAAMSAASPNRPPVHPHYPPTSSATPLLVGQQSGLLASPGRLQRSNSLGGSSPPGSFLMAGMGSPGTRLARASSLNSKKSYPNRVCCNALLAAYARAQPARWRRALKLLDVMWQCGGELVPDIVSYNTVMKACGNAQQTDIAFELYHQMQQRGIKPTVATYGTLITIASEAQAYGRVTQSWGWLQASGLPVHITCVNSYLTALIKEDSWDDAVQLFNQLKAGQLGVRPNSVTYNILMSACLARDKPQHAKALFDEMTACNLSPTLISYNTLLHAFAKMGAWEDSLRVLHQLCGSPAVRPSASSFSTVFCTLSNVAAAVGDMDKQYICTKALELYELMQMQQGLYLDSTLFRNMITTFVACRRPDMVLELALLMNQQGNSLDPATAAAALDALQQAAAWHVAGQLLKCCHDAGNVMNARVMQQVLLSCALEGAWKAAKEVLQVAASAKQLDGVTQLLQQYRSQLQAAHSTGGQLSPAEPQLPGLLNPDTLDELLMMALLQSQYTSGDWAQGLAWYRQVKQGRGPLFAANNGALHGTLLELLVVRGGAAGLVAAIQVVDECHATGTMVHYILHPTSGGDCSSIGNSRSPTSSPMATAAMLNLSAVSAAMVSPEQQLIWQLEHAAISSSPPAAPPTPAMNAANLANDILMSMSSGGSPPGFVSRTPSQGFAGASQGFAAGSQGIGGAAEQQGFPGVSQGLAASGRSLPIGLSSAGHNAAPQALACLDVRGCSVIEAVVLVMSWLGRLVEEQGSGRRLPGEVLAIMTGGAGHVATAELQSIMLHKHARSAAATADGTAPEVSDAEAATSNGASAAISSSSSTTTAIGGSPTALAAAEAPTPSAADDMDVPNGGVSAHAAVLAVLLGHLQSLLGCNNSMDYLMPLSESGRLVLGLLCCSALPLLLPDANHGGGVLVPVEGLRAAVSAALEAASAAA